MVVMKEKYQIFARKYRPQSFSEVIGQEAVVQTLKNSLKYKKTAQAYLFAGPRGIGKTTLTRLFAKALNCEKLTPDNEPCNQCRSCKEITNTSSLDVIEIDGASNRGIDDIRQINETIAYAPSSGRYKIYIIDEVHMLTKEAFNALLKTLEEPPPTVKFFFATTEPHKVLPTITSRCQRYDLKPISHDLIIKKLKEIADDQHREINIDALSKIAKFSEGSLRDGESMLDQILCYSDSTITEEMINKIFGLIAQDYFFELDKAVKENNIAKAIKITDSLYQEGKDFTFFIDTLVDHFRKIIILKLDPDADIFLTESMKEGYIEASKIYSLDQCLSILDLLMKSYLQLQKTPSKRCFLEMLLIEIIRSKNKVPLQVLVQKLAKLENDLKSIPNSFEKIIIPPSEIPQVVPQKQPLKEPVHLSTPFPPQTEKEIISPAEKFPPPLSDICTKPSHEPPSNNLKPPSMQEKALPKLEAVPFNLSDEPLSHSPKTQKPSSSHDTLINFAAVELEGIIKKE